MCSATSCHALESLTLSANAKDRRGSITHNLHQKTKTNKMETDTTLDPLGLNIDLRSVDTSRPVLKAGEYIFEIDEMSVVAKKDDETKRNLMAVLKLVTEGAQGVDDKPINPGYQLRKYMPLQQSDKDNAPDFKRDITLFTCHAFGIDADQKNAHNRPSSIPPLNEFHGRRLKLILTVKDDDTGKTNEIKAIKAA